VGAYTIRQFGDPVLRQQAVDVTDIDGGVARLARDMVKTMYAADGLGLAAPQVGIQRRVLVYDLDDGAGPQTLINPRLIEASGEWLFEEGCLSMSGLYFPIVRPRDVHVTAFNLDGNEVSIEATELLARLLQHELDHLEGRLLLELLDDEQRTEAMKVLRARLAGGSDPLAPVVH
jgi:peptide deformylase